MITLVHVIFAVAIAMSPVAAGHSGGHHYIAAPYDTIVPHP